MTTSNDDKVPGTPGQSAAPAGERAGRGTVLVIDDSRAGAKALGHLLLDHQACSAVEYAEDGFVGFRVLREKPVDLVLCDLRMPRCDGFQFLQLKATQPEMADIPVIMLTAQSQNDEHVRALDAGAADYVIKPYAVAELLSRARMQLKVRALERELSAQRREIERLSQSQRPHPPDEDDRPGPVLTDALVRELERCRRYSHTLSLARVGIAVERASSDSAQDDAAPSPVPHTARDSASRALEACLRAQARASDLVVRHGTESFSLLLPETHAQAAAMAARRIQARIASLLVATPAGTLGVRASFGIVDSDGTSDGTSDGKDEPSASTLWQAAAEALHEAEQSPASVALRSLVTTAEK